MKGRRKDIGKLLSAYVDGELSPDQKAYVEAELAACPECREEYSRLLRMRALVWEVFQEEQRGIETRSIWEAIEGRIEAMDRERAGGNSLVLGLRAWWDRLRLGLASPLAPAGFAAAAGTAVVAGLLFMLARPSSDRPAAPTRIEKVASTTSSDSQAPARSAETTEPKQHAAPSKVASGGVEAAMGAAHRRAAEPEKSFHRNELYVDSTSVEQGIVIVDIEPDGDSPAIVWHIPDDPTVQKKNDPAGGAAGRDGVI